jgi:hypothetical protein
VSNILTGLPASYTDFKKQYNWIRARDLNQTPDLDFLFNRLFMEEEDQDKSKATRTRKTNNDKHDKPDRSHLKCTHSDCGRTGHEAKDCWVAHPEKMLPKLKEKLDKRKAGGYTKNDKTDKTDKTKTDKPKGLVAMTQGYMSDFKNALVAAEAKDDNATDDKVGEILLRTINTPVVTGLLILDKIVGQTHTVDQEALAIWKLVLDHADQPQLIAETTHPDVDKWVPSSNITIRTILDMIKTAVREGKIILIDRINGMSSLQSSMNPSRFSSGMQGWLEALSTSSLASAAARAFLKSDM